MSSSPEPTWHDDAHPRIRARGESIRVPHAAWRERSPCDGCEHAARCANELLACEAFFRWTHTSLPWSLERCLPLRSTPARELYLAVFPKEDFELDADAVLEEIRACKPLPNLHSIARRIRVTYGKLLALRKQDERIDAALRENRNAFVAQQSR